METTPESVLVQCNYCHEERPEGSLFTTEFDGSVCSTCREDFFTCDSCGRVLSDRRYSNDGLCDSCDEDDDIEPSGDITRPYSTHTLRQYQSKKAGTYITSERVFSAEIECYYPDSDAARSVSNELPREIGIEFDGSLNARGIEFQTPKLKGKKGEDTVKKLCSVLNAHGFTVDKSAGLHIHLDAADFIPKRKTRFVADKLRRLWSFYLEIDDIMLSFLPRERRNNTYCRPFAAAYHSSEIATRYSLQDLEKYWYRTTDTTDIKRRKRGKDSSRYVGINLHSLLANKHLEIRYHSATINALKILHWVELHQRIMDVCANGTLYYAPVNGAPLSERTEALFVALELPEKSRAYWRTRQQKFLTANTEENY